MAGVPQPGLTDPVDFDEQDGFNIFVQWDPDADRYCMVIEAGNDTARTLTPEQGLEWVALMYRALAIAQHDRAVALQQAVLGADVQMVSQILNALRGPREPLVMELLGVELKPIVALRPGGHLVPVVEIHQEGKPTGQWEEGDLADHAQGILLCIASVPLDTTYLKFLREKIELPHNTCTQVVADLLQYRNPKLTLPGTDDLPSEAAGPPSDPA